MPSLSRCVISPSCAMIRLDLYQELGGFNESMPVCEDYDLWLKITAKYKIGYIEEPLIKKYGGHLDQLSRKFHGMDYYRILALFELLKDLGRHAQLYDERIALIEAEIKKKSAIFLKGYEKHGKSDHPHAKKVLEIAEGIIGKLL